MECPTTGDHLHQSADLNLATSLWRNFDRSGYEDDGLGFDPTVRGYNAEERTFCSNIWIFKLSEVTPVATPIERCGAPENAPGNLVVNSGDGRLDLTWSTPVGNITGYEIRWRLGMPASDDKAPWIAETIATTDSTYATKIAQYQTTYGWKAISGSGPSTTSHTLTGLTNGTEYTVQVRAKNARGVGPASTASATPAKPTATPPPTPTQCTVRGVASPVGGGTVSGANTVNCGESVTLSISQAVAQAARYRFTS